MVLTDLSLIESKFLKSGYYIELELSDTTAAFFRVRRSLQFEHYYDVKTEISSWKPLAPITVSAPTYNPYFMQFVKLPLPDFQNVTDMFALNDTNEMLQVFMGIAPSPVRIYYNIPSQQPYAAYDNDTAPDSTYFDFGYQFDGFDSPLHRPHPKSEFLDVRGININFTFGNPVTVSVNPEIYFYVNRMTVEPVTDESLAAEIVNGKIPHARYPMAGIGKAAALNKQYYPDAVVFDATTLGGL